MKKNLVKAFGLVIAITVISPVTVLAENTRQIGNDFVSMEFENLIAEIQSIKNNHPEYSDDMVLAVMNGRHPDLWNSGNEKGVSDIWNALTDSEKKLCIRYPFDALKVNKAKDIATSQTEKKFGHNGLGDRSDAFRHGIWNAEMTVLIGADKAELFATAHEDKDITGNEPDGYPKSAHRDMDLHNNKVGRGIGERNRNASEDEMADIIYSAIHDVNSEFIWLHD